MKWSSCTGTTRETHNETFLMTPNYPNSNYPGNKNCRWQMKVPKGRFIQLDIDFPKNGLGDWCYDYFKIVDKFAPYDDKKMFKFCSTNKPPKALTSFGNEIEVQFHSSPRYHSKGFEIRYKSVKPGMMHDL